jgi:putative DNA primase/helicase
MMADVFELHPGGIAPPVESANTTEIFPAPSDTMGVARILLEEIQEDGETTVRRWRGGWWKYEGPHWAEAEGTAIRKWIYTRLEYARYEWRNPTTTQVETRPWNPNRSKVDNVLDAMESISHLAETVSPPSWLDTGKPAGELIGCANGLLDVNTQRLRPATPRYFGLVSVPFDFDPTAGEPVEWLRFLRSLWPDETGEEIDLLQEWFGYVLSGRTDLQKIFFMLGPPRCGKGTIAWVLSRLMGLGNVVAPTLAGLGTNFGMEPLLGKTLAVIGDARLATRGQEAVVERLLSISGEDMITVDRKNRQSWSGKFPTRVMILSNELPKFGDASGAIADRFEIVKMTRSFLGQEDHRLKERLETELPGILRWALAGIVRLNNRTGRFTKPASAEESVQALAGLVSTVSVFAEDVCELDAEHVVVKQDLFQEWELWCEENGHRASSMQKFSSDLRSKFPEITDAPRPKGQPRRWSGIQVSAEWTATHAGAPRWKSAHRYED